MLLAEGSCEEGSESSDNVVREPFAGRNGDDAIFVGSEGRIGDDIQEVLNAVALVGEHEARSVKAITAKQTTDTVGDEVTDGINCEEAAVLLVRAGRAFVWRIAEIGVGGQRYSVQRNLNGYLILKTVRLGPVTIVL